MFLNCGASVLQKTFESPLDSKEINPVNPKEINPEYSLERLILKLKLQYFDHLMWRVVIGKDSAAGKGWGQKEKGVSEDEMVRLHNRLHGHAFEQGQR